MPATPIHLDVNLNSRPCQTGQSLNASARNLVLRYGIQVPVFSAHGKLVAPIHYQRHFHLYSVSACVLQTSASLPNDRTHLTLHNPRSPKICATALAREIATFNA